MIYITKLAFISDIHGNIQSLEYVLNDISKQNVDDIICLGDMVTKYFYPNDVVELVKKECKYVIKGNCDNYVVKNPNFKYTRKDLGATNLDYINKLNEVIILNYKNIQINLLHATVYSLDEMYNPLVNNNTSCYKNNTILIPNHLLVGENKQLSFVGHTHMPFIVDNNGLIYENNSISNVDKSLIINTGSIGDPCYYNETENEFLIDNVLNYTTLEISENSYEIKQIKLPYTDLLEKIYIDRLNMEKYHIAPHTPNDDERILKSININKQRLRQ